METAIWVAVVVTATFLLTIGGLVWKLATRQANTESSAAAAALAVLNNSLKIEKMASELAAHRENVAKEYVSYHHMTNLENRLIDAVNSLGNRIDGLFSRIATPQH